MRYLTVILTIILTACGGGGGGSPLVSPSTVDNSVPLLVGDSRCLDNKYIPNRNCAGKRKLVDLFRLDDKYDIILLALGINDMYAGVSAGMYKAHLNMLVDDYNGRLVCLLESTFNYKIAPEIVHEYRQAMMDVCPEHIDPNIDPFHPDRVHYTDYNYQQVKEAYDSIAF